MQVGNANTDAKTNTYTNTNTNANTNTNTNTNTNANADAYTFPFRFWQYSTYANSVQNCQQNKLKYRQSDARAYGFLEKFFCARSSFKPFVTPKPKNCFRLVVVLSSLPYIPFSRVASKRRSKNMTLQVSETKRNISDDWSLRQFYISFRFTRISLLSHLITI